jgi:opacity protein-like surface antigen
VAVLTNYNENLIWIIQLNLIFAQQNQKAMKKIIFTIVLFVAATCMIFAQNNNTQGQGQGQQGQGQGQGQQGQGQGQNQKKDIQPDMQKDTVALFQGHFAGPIKAVDILLSDSLTLNKIGVMIVGFDLVYRQDTSTVTFSSKTCKLTADMKTALKTLKSGQNFAFKNIRIMAGKNGVPIKPTYDFIEMFIENAQK